MYTHALESTYQLVQQNKVKMNTNEAPNPVLDHQALRY